jgi:hypothetical protein
LPEAVLGLYKTLGHEQIVLVFSIDMGDTPAVPQDFYRCMETLDLYCTVGFRKGKFDEIVIASCT